MRFEGVVFDLGDILYDASQWRRWLVEELQRRGVDVSYGQLVEEWEHLLVDVYRGTASYWNRFRDLMSGFELSPDTAAAVESLARTKAVEIQKDRVPMAGVPQTLPLLRENGVRLAILSDNESGESGIRRILSELGIAEHFDAVVSSADIGRVKPEPEAFEAAAQALDLTAPSCAFVGHDLDELVGARDAGMYVISFNCSADLPADRHINNFTELADLCN